MIELDQNRKVKKDLFTFKWGDIVQNNVFLEITIIPFKCIEQIKKFKRIHNSSISIEYTKVNFRFVTDGGYEFVKS